jgi:hypothetical protein
MRLRAVLGIAAVGLFLAPGFSHAGDYCISFPSAPTFIVVGRGFAIPPKGQCRPWNGFSAQADLNSPSNGVGCTSSDGTHFNLMFTTAFAEAGALYEVDEMSLALPAQTGNDFSTGFDGGSGSSSGPLTVNGAKCSKIAIPAETEPGPASQMGNSVH